MAVTTGVVGVEAATVEGMEAAQAGGTGAGAMVGGQQAGAAAPTAPEVEVATAETQSGCREVEATWEGTEMAAAAAVVRVAVARVAVGALEVGTAEVGRAVGRALAERGKVAAGAKALVELARARAVEGARRSVPGSYTAPGRRWRRPP